jgi:cobalt-zinc-cadmium efflux system outer membrane protein
MLQEWPSRCLLALLTGACWLTGRAGAADVQTLPPLVVPMPRPVLTLGQAVQLALEQNLELAAFRQQRGIAAANVVIARTYPFNPVYEGEMAGASGPPAAGVTNHFPQIQKVLLELEVRGQGRYRRQAAQAGLTRTEWEVAAQELKLITLVVLAFQDVLYEQAKLRLAEDRLRLNEETAKIVRGLRATGSKIVTPADLILVESEVTTARADLKPAQLALTKAQNNLRKALGIVGDVPEIAGPLAAPPLTLDAPTVEQMALDRRPDRRARAAAVAEAAAKLRLEIANRFGNPTIGPSYECDNSSVRQFGAVITFPIPALNTHPGQIALARAEQIKAMLDLRQTEVQIRQEVQAALARLAAARDWVYTYQTKLLPQLQSSLDTLQKLLAAGDPSVDVLRVVTVRRSLLAARGAYLDALWELSQAQADLIAAVGAPELVLGIASPPTSFSGEGGASARTD